ncbi:MAG: 3-hydroxyacyl-CoA dehydrogenase [Hyphomicrobiaceae bacterium]|nr:3-hydroxyacyl-CoA dehydrogenase [Hyphomicrobiaceae bacterium]
MLAFGKLHERRGARHMAISAETVGIVGAGLIGRSWANVFARSGWHVVVWDPVPEARAAAVELIGQSLADLAEHGLVVDAAAARARVRVVDTLEAAVRDADFVQESGPETREAKIEIFKQLDAAARPDTVLASSTSAIVSSQFTEGLKGRHRCVVAHPVNPPHLVPVVEICGAPWTSEETKERTRAIFKSVGQVPVTVKKEIDGFVLNRLQVALLAEAFRLVQDGVVSPEDLDHTVADGLGLRWAFMGPFETIELNAPEGIADYCKRYTPWFKRYMADMPLPDVWDDMKVKLVADAWGPKPSAAGVLKKSQWRNRRLAALIAHKRKSPGYGGGA